MTLSDKQLEMCETSKWDFSDLNALFLNCTLKRSPEMSHTQGLIDMSKAIMEKNGVTVECLRPVDYGIAYGVWPDMTKHGWERDDWPEIYEKVRAAEILILTSPIWNSTDTMAPYEAIETLPEKYRMPLVLFAIGEYDIKEIASDLHLNGATV